MKNLIALITLIILISCNHSQPDCLIYDTVRVEVGYPVFDPVAAYKIDSMQAHFMNWRDSTESALIDLSNSERDRLLDLVNHTYHTIDSLKRSLKFDHKIICNDGSMYRVYYDTIALKSVLIFTGYDVK